MRWMGGAHRVRADPHAPYQEQVSQLLRELRMTCGDAFAEMWAAAGLGAPPDWLT